MPQRPAGFKGWVGLVKTAGQAVPIVTTQTNIMPTLTADPKNPHNNQYFLGLNADQNPANDMLQKRTPTLAIAAPLIASWVTPTFFNSLIGLLDASFDTDEFGIGVNDGNSTQVYDGCKCQMIRIVANSGASSPMAHLEFVAIYGDNEKSVPTVVATPVTAAGQLYGPAQITFNGTVTECDGIDMRIMRPQGYNNFLDGTLYSDIIQSGMTGGSITLYQNPLAATVPGGTMTVRLGTAGTGLAITLLTNLDERHKPVMASRGRMANTYSLIDLTAGAVPFSFAAF